MTDTRAMGSPVHGRPRATLDQAMRYLSVTRFLEAHGVEEVVDVGSGATGLAAWWPGHVIGVDMRFDGEPAPNLTPVVGSALELPFPDRSHRAVVCTDVMEHLPAHLRRPAFDELLRVSSELVWVAFPAGAGAARADERLAALGGRAGRELPGWLRDHLDNGIPDSDDALAWPAPGYRRNHRTRVPTWVHMGVVALEHAPGGRALDLIARSGRLTAALAGLPGTGYRLEQWFQRDGS